MPLHIPDTVRWHTFSWYAQKWNRYIASWLKCFLWACYSIPFKTLYDKLHRTLKSVQAIYWASWCIHDMVMYFAWLYLSLSLSLSLSLFHIYIYIYIYIYMNVYTSNEMPQGSCNGIVQIFLRPISLPVSENINLIKFHCDKISPVCRTYLCCRDFILDALSSAFVGRACEIHLAQSLKFETNKRLDARPIALCPDIVACKVLLYPNNRAWKNVCKRSYNQCKWNNGVVERHCQNSCIVVTYGPRFNINTSFAGMRLPC